MTNEKVYLNKYAFQEHVDYGISHLFPASQNPASLFPAVVKSTFLLLSEFYSLAF